MARTSDVICTEAEVLDEHLKKIKSSFDSTRNCINYLFERLDPDDTSPIAANDKSIAEALIDELSNLSKNLSADNIALIKKEIKAIFKPGMKNAQAIWVLFMEFPEKEAKMLSNRCANFITTIQNKKCAPFHLHDLLTQIVALEAEIKSLLDEIIGLLENS